MSDGNLKGVYGNLQAPPQGGYEASDDAMIQEILSCSINSMPVQYEVAQTVQFPLSLANFNAWWGANGLDLASVPDAATGIGAFSTFVNPRVAITQADLAIAAFGVILYGEPKSFSAIGNSTANTATTARFSPDVFRDLSITDMDPAVLEWGSPVWQAIWHLSQACEFQWMVGDQSLVVHELVSDIGAIGCLFDAYGMSDSTVPIIDYVRRVNDRYRAIGNGRIFHPLNAIREGSAGGAADANQMYKATRLGDLAPTTWGSIKAQGAMYRKLPKLLCIPAGCPYSMKLEVKDQVHFNLFRQEILDTNDAIGQCVYYDANQTDTSAAVVERDLCTCASPQTISVDTKRCKFKGGILKLAIRLKGWRLPPGGIQYLMTKTNAVCPVMR